jgi:hypothetical protein
MGIIPRGPIPAAKSYFFLNLSWLSLEKTVKIRDIKGLDKFYTFFDGLFSLYIPGV